MSETEQVDPRAILAALGVPQVASVTRVSGGWDTALWRIVAEGNSYALRVFTKDRAVGCKREALVMRTLADRDLPIPRVHAEGVGQGQPALLLSWCAGRTVLEEIRARPWRVWLLARAMGLMHARIHDVSVAHALSETLPHWLARAGGVGPGVETRLRFAADWPGSVLHLDYHPLNVMTDGRTITGVLDWANVAYGDRRADLARTVTLLRLAPIQPGTPAVVQLALRAIVEAGWRHGYRELQAVDPFTDLGPFYVWAGTWMQRDLRPKLGRPGVWLREADLSRIHNWTRTWTRRITTLR